MLALRTGGRWAIPTTAPGAAGPGDVFPGEVLNTQPPLQELWMAARAGGYHYKHVAGRWLDREGRELFDAGDRALIVGYHDRPESIRPANSRRYWQGCES